MGAPFLLKNHMKKILPILLALITVVSCGPRYSGPNGEKTQKDAEKEFLESLTEAKQTEVLEMADNCLELLLTGRLDEAVRMIYILHDDIVYQKSDEYTQELINRFTIMPVYSYKREYYSFSTQGNNDICYVTKMGPSENAPTIKLTFNPVLVDDVWYLAFKDGNMSSKALPVEKQIHEMAPAPEEIIVNK